MPHPFAFFWRKGVKPRTSTSFVHRKGANIEAKDKLGNTALILALGQGITRIVKLLREKGAH